MVEHSPSILESEEEATMTLNVDVIILSILVDNLKKGTHKNPRVLMPTLAGAKQTLFFTRSHAYI